jgi:uncharacterized delta-60 repeat protein
MSTKDIEGRADGFTSVVIQSDGKIVAVGSTFLAGISDIILFRYNSDGSLDTTFDADGIVITDLEGDFDRAYDLAIQDKSKIIVIGTIRDATTDIVVLRYDSDGSLDTSFNKNGITITDVAGFEDAAYGIYIQNNGKILLAGRSNSITDENVALYRYNSDGGLDTSFDTDGILITDAVSGFNDRTSALAIQDDGKIVVTGRVDVNGRDDIILLRYLSDITNSSDGDIGNGEESSSDNCFIGSIH